MEDIVARFVALKEMRQQLKTEAQESYLRALALHDDLTDARESIREELGDRQEWDGEIDGKEVRVFIDGEHHVQVHGI